MRILYVLPQLPYPPDRGGKVVTYNIIEYMRQRHDVSVVSLVHSAEDVEAARTYASRVTNLWSFPCRSRWHPPSVLRAPFSNRPYKAIRFMNPRMSRKVRDLCGSGEFDLVHAQNFYAAQYVPVERTVKAVHYKENFEARGLSRYAGSRTNGLARFLLGKEARKTERFEVDLCRRFDRVMVISRVDMDLLAEKVPDARFEYQPASIDTEFFKPGGEQSEAGLVFVGSLDYYANSDGLTWFCREVLPKMGDRGNTGLTIVGRVPGSDLLSLAGDPRVRFAGWVEDVRPVIGSAAVYVVPIRVGAGVRIKILEAMAMGKAIVSSSVGCEGIECRPGRDLIVADDPRTFAAELKRLLADPDARRNLSRNARETAAKHYSTQVVLPRMEQSYLDLVG